MTCDNVIIGIFQRNESFWHYLIVWKVIVLELVVQGTILKMAGSLEAFL